MLQIKRKQHSMWNASDFFFIDPVNKNTVKCVSPLISIVLSRTQNLRNAIKILVSKTELCPWHSRLTISHSQ